MLDEPRCSERHCKHFLGVYQEDGTEETERQCCAAFPKGIPDEIAYGTNLHLVPYSGDHGIIFEQDSQEGTRIAPQAFLKAEPDRTAEDLAKELPLVADILLGLFGESILELFPPPPAKDYEPCRDDRGRFAPCGGGGFSQEERDKRTRERVERADALLKDAKERPLSEVGKHELVKHLLTMTAKELKQARDKHGLNSDQYSQNTKARLIHMLGERVNELAAEAKANQIKDDERFMEGKPIEDRIAKYTVGEQVRQAVMGHEAKVSAADEKYRTSYLNHDAKLTDHYALIASPNSTPKEQNASYRAVQKAEKAMKGAFEERKQLLDASKDLFKSNIGVKDGHNFSVVHDDGAGAGPAKVGPTQVARMDEAKKFTEDMFAKHPGDPKMGLVINQNVDQATHALDRAHCQTGMKYGDHAVIRTQPSDSTSVHVHELGHHYETQIPGILKAANDFVEARCGKESPTKLADKYPSSGYKSYEYGRKDDFEKAFGSEHTAYYAGKTYNGLATEIVSLGLEQIHRDPVKFAKGDPEYFNFMVGIMKGHLRG